MFKNYFKTASRYLLRNKTFTLVNIAGLSLGMACAVLAILFVNNEVSYDRFHKNTAQLFRLTTTITNADNSRQTLGTTGQVQGPAFKAEIPEIADYVRILGTTMNVTGNNKSLAVKNIYADNNFFNVFSFPLLYGNTELTLINPNTIVLSQNTAIKFFGTEDVVGRVMQVEEGNGFKNLIVSGIAKNPPSNSSIQFDAVIPFSYLQTMFTDDNWLNQYLTTFILLKPNTNSKTVEQKFSKVFIANAQTQLKEANSGAKQFQFGLTPITTIHLNILGLTSNGSAVEERGLSNTSSVTYSYILSAIIAFIVLMACINFINLNIAVASKRSKEIGVKKIIGSSRSRIVFQFLTESFIVCVISFLFAVVISELFIPVFNKFSGKDFSIKDFFNPLFFIYGILLMTLCIILSGTYPAFKLSSFNPIQALLKKPTSSVKNYLGKALIVFQFTLAVSLIIITCVYFSQMKFISNKDLGYNPHDIIKINLPPQRTNESVINVLKNELLNNESIQEITTETGISPSDVIVNGKQVSVKRNGIDASYISELGISLKEGRNFYLGNSADSSNSILINESFAKAAGLQNPVGQQVKNIEDNRTKTIVGVIKDYHFTSLKENIQPQVFDLNYGDNMLVKLKMGKEVEALSALNNIFKSNFPGHFYEYQFLDDKNAIAYQTDEQWKQIITYASVIAIVICCIGLFGLSVFVAQHRIKEIGIRKILGASVSSIVAMLTKDFLKLVIISILIASPPAYLIMNKWLQSYAYRVQISWWIFVIVGMLAVFIAVITISFQSIKAAIANPVKSLRSE
ncbi:MAG TPA: ABC transporter permease [Puia sp.]|nr:ABC transporter permease [Puia sp.]